MTTTQSHIRQARPASVAVPSTGPAAWLTAITLAVIVGAAAVVSTIAVLTSDRTMTEVAPAAMTGEEVTA